jgi:hypothetical protein
MKGEEQLQRSKVKLLRRSLPVEMTARPKNLYIDVQLRYLKLTQGYGRG